MCDAAGSSAAVALAGEIPGDVRRGIIGGVCRGWQVLVGVLDGAR